MAKMTPTRERRRHVERLVRGEHVATDARISYRAKVLYVVAGLVCNDLGYLKRDTLNAAVLDAELVSMAQNILTKCGCPPAEGRLS